VDDRASLSANLPWTIRIFEIAPLPPAALGALIALAAYSFYLSCVQLFGWAEADGLLTYAFWRSVRGWFELLMAALLGAAPALTAHSLRSAVRELRALRPVLRGSDVDFAERLREITSFRRGPLAAATLLGVPLGLATVLHPAAWPEGYPPATDPLLIYIVARNALLFALLARAVYVDVAIARRFSDIGRRWCRIDLLDLEPLAPFARRGLRGALMWIVATSVVVPLFFADYARHAAPGLFLSIVAVAAAVLVLPVFGVHRAVGEARAAELQRSREHVRRRRDDRPAESFPGWSLADVLAYEARIAGVRSWPFTPSTLLRFSLYVGLGVGSWLGAALVERMLGSVLG
jgi:hypothetical protein